MELTVRQNKLDSERQMSHFSLICRIWIKTWGGVHACACVCDMNREIEMSPLQGGDLNGRIGDQESMMEPM